MSWQPLPMPKRAVVASGQQKAAEASDPYVASVVQLTTPGHDGAAAMARTFIEEFARIGWSRDRITRMFRQPRFAAAHAVYLSHGADFVTDLIAEVLGPGPASERETETRRA